MLRSIRKAFAALRAQGLPVTPARLRGVELLPAWLLVGACQWALRTSYAELIVARHATVAREEMAVLAEQLHALVDQMPNCTGLDIRPELLGSFDHSNAKCNSTLWVWKNDCLPSPDSPQHFMQPTSFGRVGGGLPCF